MNSEVNPFYIISHLTSFFLELSSYGLISILKDDREKMFIENVKVPNYPCITGICFSKYFPF